MHPNLDPVVTECDKMHSNKHVKTTEQAMPETVQKVNLRKEFI